MGCACGGGFWQDIPPSPLQDSWDYKESGVATSPLAPEDAGVERNLRKQGVFQGPQVGVSGLLRSCGYPGSRVDPNCIVVSPKTSKF